MNAKKIKILYTIPNFETAGSGKVVYDLVKNIDRTIFEPEICCFHRNGAYFKVIENLGVKIHLFPFAINYRPFFTFPIRLLKIVRFFYKHQFNIIHSWHWSSDFSEPLAAKLAGIPFVYTKKSMGWGNKAWKWRSFLSSKIITINSDMGLFFLNKLSEKVIPIPLGVDTDYYHPQLKSYQTPEGLKFEETDFIIVSVVNLIPVKGIELLIQAVIELANNKIKLCIVGKDTSEYAQSLKKKAALNSNIYFLGKKLDVRPYHAIADLFVIPTLELGEGLPVAPIEAMASERIVIGSAVSGIKDVLKPFQNCIFEPSNVESLKERIEFIRSMDESRRGILQKKMSQFVINEFSQPRFSTAHENLYKNLIK